MGILALHLRHLTSRRGLPRDIPGMKINILPLVGALAAVVRRISHAIETLPVEPVHGWAKAGVAVRAGPHPRAGDQHCEMLCLIEALELR